MLHKRLIQHSSDILALLILALGALAAAGFLLRDDVFIYGDHPGHYWLTWFTLQVAIPEQGNVAAWMPAWYAGYQELQFYPPGFAMLAWLLHAVSFEQLSPAFSYQLVFFLAYALPGFTIYYALRHLRFGILTAFAGGVLGLTFPTIFAGTTAPFIGMIGSRLAFALNPLILVWLMDVAHGRGWRYWFPGVFALAAAILLHPYHEIGILLAVAIYVLVARLNLLRAGFAVVSAVVMAVLLDAFWLVPLVMYASSEMVPILRTTFDQTRRFLTDAELYLLAFLGLGSLLYFRSGSDRQQRDFVITLLVLVVVLAAAMVAIHFVLIDSLNIYALDPIRLIGEYYLALILLAAIGLGALTEWVTARIQTENVRRMAEVGIVGAVCVWFVLPFAQKQQYYMPQAGDEPRFLQAARDEYALDEFWNALRESPGRVWFTSSSFHLTKHEKEPLPTTLAALTPLFSDREIIGGTYSRWSPIAALLWVGDTDPEALHGLVEEADDKTLVGVPIEELDGEQIFEWARRFNATTLVAGADDFQTRTLLDASPHFQSYYNNGLFFAYRVLEYPSTWVEGENAAVENVDYAGNRVSFHARNVGENAAAHVKVYGGADCSWRGLAHRAG